MSNKKILFVACLLGFGLTLAAFLFVAIVALQGVGMSGASGNGAPEQVSITNKTDAEAWLTFSYYVTAVKKAPGQESCHVGGKGSTWIRVLKNKTITISYIRDTVTTPETTSVFVAASCPAGYVERFCARYKIAEGPPLPEEVLQCPDYRPTAPASGTLDLILKKDESGNLLLISQ